MTIRHLYPAVEPSLNLDFANSKKLDSRINFVRATTGTYTDENGIIRTAAANEARFDHDTDGNSLGLLIEESRANSLTYSEEFDNAAWTKARTTITANAATAPDGTTTADKLIRGTDNNINVVYKTVSLPQTTYTLSVFAKKGEYTFCTLNLPNVQGWDADRWVSVNLADGSYTTSASAPTSTSVVAYPNGWYRISITHAASATVARAGYIEARSSAGYGVQAGDGTSGIYIWGAQFEAGAFPTSYIPTSGSTVTRSADVASMTGTNFSSWYNQGEGTFFWEGTQQFASPQEAVLALSDGSTSNRISFRPRNTLIDTLGVRQLSLGLSTGDTPGGIKLAYTLALNASGGTLLNRLGSDTDSTAISMPALTQMEINRVEPSGSIRASGHVARITYYPVRLPDATLQALTL